MSVLGEVFDSLRSMTQWQLLLAFLACMGYVLSQGRLIEPKARRIAAALALVAAVAFAFESAEWTNAAMLLAFAVAGLGLFVGATWLISRLLGLASSQPPGDADALEPPAAAALPPPRPRVAAQPKHPAHSH
jgi:hypothetical protein